MGIGDFADVAADNEGKALGRLNEVSWLNSDSEGVCRICRKNNHLYVVDRVGDAASNAVP